MTRTEAQRRADKAYKAKLKRIGLEFPPHEQHLYEFVKRQGVPASEYIKDLIREDRMQWFELESGDY